MEIENKIFKQMSNISKLQQKSTIVLFLTSMLLRGNADFRNPSRLAKGSARIFNTALYCGQI
jgi:hypothetical protein